MIDNLKKDRVFERLISWAFYGVLFALIPLIVSIPLKFFLANVKGIESFSDSTELIFFSLYISASTLSDIISYSSEFKKNYTKFELILKNGLVMSVLFSAVLYATILLINLLLSEKLVLREDIFIHFRLWLFYIQIIFAFFMLLGTGTVQYFIGIIEQDKTIEKLTKELKNE